MPHHRLPLLALTTGAILALSLAAARGDVLLSDNFNNLTLGQDLNGRSPTVNLLNSAVWAAPSSAINTIVGNGNGGLTANEGGSNTSAVLDLGTNFLSTNPGVYELSLDITQPSGNSGTAWIGLGFSPSGGTASNLVANNGAPWMLFRLNGQVNVYAGAGATNQINTTTTFATTVGHTFKLTLDTSTTFWTLNAFVDSTQLDLNGAAAGSTYTFTTNPTTSHYISFATGTNVGSGSATLDNFTFSGPVPVPEPRMAVLFPVTLAIFAGWRRWRRLATS